MELASLTIDCRNAATLAAFWAAAFECDTDPNASNDFAALQLPGGQSLSFVGVPEPKTVKNRVHLDVRADDLDATVERLLALGATVHATYDEGGSRWTTMLDVEGNEFCVL